MFRNSELFNKSVNIAHMLISQKVAEGDVVIDATAGNGNDTFSLAKLVGPKGIVFAFDVQSQAIENTRSLLSEHGLLANVELINDGHENLDKYVKGSVKLVLFNLGYLPKADRSITTKKETTLIAMQKSLALLDKYGLVLVVIYPGHDEGMKEKDEILEFASELSQAEYNVFYVDLLNQKNDPPILLGIEKQ